jgi:hypothetical protein
MTETVEQQQTPPPPAPPTNSAEASARLGALSADKAWSDKLLAGDPYAAKEFSDLHVMIDAGDKVDSALAGLLQDPDGGNRVMVARNRYWGRRHPADPFGL